MYQIEKETVISDILAKCPFDLQFLTWDFS